MPGLHDSIRYLKGVGDKRAKLYEKLGVTTIGSLLRLFPRTYQDYTSTVPIGESPVGQVCCVRGRVYKKQGEQRIRKGLSLFKVFVTDDTGDLTITLFNNPWLFESLNLEQEYCFYGKMQGNLLRREMNSPNVQDPNRENGIKPVYPLTEGLTNRMVCGAMEQALELWGDQLEDVFPVWLKEQEKLCHLRYAYENIHFPKDLQALSVARKRFVFEELLILQLGLLLLRGRNRTETGIQIKNRDLAPFYQALPFVLTGAQKRAIEDALHDLSGSVPMNRLVQGDVGSGKTMVACALAYIMAKNGYQTAVMAPTELLAVQHAKTFSGILEPMGIPCALLTGSMTAKEKNKLKQEIAEGVYPVVLGTHALIQDTVSFASLGLVVTDEQHRFGVNQRAKLAQKGKNPHKLVMSATPIPRTLALIIYGDLDVSVIDEMPKGRLPVKTYRIHSDKRLRAFGFIKEHIEKGYQAYIVCPLIQQEESSQNEAQAVEEYAKKLMKTPLGKTRIGVLHGKMKAAEKEQVMKAFSQHELDLLVSTTVVEVGVDVPNAVIMLIENAEHFGLSQLHQLRGRVGRGNVQSHCILVTDSNNEQTVQRMKVMTQSSDGFFIAEQDLKARGPGDFFGERQHGLPELKVANMAEDMGVLMHTQQVAKEILAKDADLEAPEHAGMKKLVQELFDRSVSSD
ncbi:MAG: ATP-dependent DNA helicase RecG [Massiliimalia sp.]|jgi:ATP-dependent DNA helicase RecG